MGGVHFLVESDPYAIGWKTVAVSLSDLAAMGAEPAWATLALTVPEAHASWLQAFSRGLFDLAEMHNLALVGGNTSRGPVSLTLQAHGFVPPGQALRRSGAQPGDILYVTGTLGDAALGLDLCLGRVQEAFTPADSASLVGRLERPQPRVATGLALRGIASAAIDLSDGLVADLGHILTASQVGATVYLERIPRSPALQRYTVPWEKLVAGGDDYELCFTVPPNRQDVLTQTLARLGAVACTPIGVIEPHPGIAWIDATGCPVDIQATGFRHFP